MEQEILDIISRYKKSIPLFVINAINDVLQKENMPEIDRSSAVVYKTEEAESIIEAVSLVVNIPVGEIKQKTRKGTVVDARRIAINHIYPRLLSSVKTAQLFDGINNSDVVYHKKKYKDLVTTDRCFRQRAIKVKDFLQEKKRGLPDRQTPNNNNENKNDTNID